MKLKEIDINSMIQNLVIKLKKWTKKNHIKSTFSMTLKKRKILIQIKSRN